jgi:hypothetical protein
VETGPVRLSQLISAAKPSADLHEIPCRGFHEKLSIIREAGTETNVGPYRKMVGGCGLPCPSSPRWTLIHSTEDRDRSRCLVNMVLNF